MTGPADDGDLCVKMLNSGAPGVMLDLEDSCVNEWSHHEKGVANILACLRGELSYHDKKRGRTVNMQPNGTVIFIRPRGLHLNQAGLVAGELVSASLFDVARIFYGIEPAELNHPLCIYIPKSESAEEALWWRDLFRRLAQGRGLPHDYIKCMALVESHPMAFQMEEFAYHLRDHIMGLNLGPVSYTHLDVYKRQPMGRLARRTRHSISPMVDETGEISLRLVATTAAALSTHPNSP